MDIAQVKKQTEPVFKKHGIHRASLFGSMSRNEGTEASDVDILLELPVHASLLDYMRIKHELEDVLRKSVDLVEYAAIKPRLKEHILKDQIPIYPS